MIKEVINIIEYWCDDLVIFLIGCFFLFEEVFIVVGFEICNIIE